MTQTPPLERLLLDDLDVEGERAADERFCTALYRALTRNVWRNDRDPEGELSPSFQRAEWLLDQGRARRPGPPARGWAGEGGPPPPRPRPAHARADRRRGRGRPHGRRRPRAAR